MMKCGGSQTHGKWAASKRVRASMKTSLKRRSVDWKKAASSASPWKSRTFLETVAADWIPITTSNRVARICASVHRADATATASLHTCTSASESAALWLIIGGATRAVSITQPHCRPSSANGWPQASRQTSWWRTPTNFIAIDRKCDSGCTHTTSIIIIERIHRRLAWVRPIFHCAPRIRNKWSYRSMFRGSCAFRITVERHRP